MVDALDTNGIPSDNQMTTKRDTNGIPVVDKLDTQVRLGKVRLGKDSIDNV